MIKKLAERRAENWELRIDNVWWIRVENVRKRWGKKRKNIVWVGQNSNFLKIYIVVSKKNRKFAAIESGGRVKPGAGANVIGRLKTRVIWCWQQKNTKASDATQMCGEPKIWSSNESDILARDEGEGYSVDWGKRIMARMGWRWMSGRNNNSGI